MTDELPVHSKLGASQMHRWAKCPGSVRLSEGIEGAPSIYAAEGTVAHSIGAECLEKNIGTVSFLGRVYEQEGFQIEVTEEMLDAVDVYLYAVRSEATKSTDRLVEHKFHLKKVHPDLYGTADCVQYHPAEKLLQVYDYKHGAGVPVEVKDNEQLKYYALGALLSSGKPAAEIEMIIVQPRCNHPDGLIRRHKISALDLLEFSADLLDAVKRTEAPNAGLLAGDHCRWCKAAAVCPELKNKALRNAQKEFEPLLPYDPAELAASLDQLPAIEAWCESVRKFAYGEATHGRFPPGYKLVEKRANRKWIDEHSAELGLQAAGLAESEMFKERELRSPAQIEKTLGKKNAEAVLAPLTKKESSGTTLVHDSDKREAVKVDARSEFEAVANG